MLSIASTNNPERTIESNLRNNPGRLKTCKGSRVNDKMPEAFPATVAEREAELIALQSAFDEYIASSRELEEELDTELAKMRKSLLSEEQLERQSNVIPFEILNSVLQEPNFLIRL